MEEGVEEEEEEEEEDLGALLTLMLILRWGQNKEWRRRCRMNLPSR